MITILLNIKNFQVKNYKKWLTTIDQTKKVLIIMVQVIKKGLRNFCTEIILEELEL